MSKLKILAIAGSTRKDSFNKQLLNAAAQAVERGGVEVIRVDLRDFPMPLYDGDLEDASGLPRNAAKLKILLDEADAFIFASPEYNASVSAVLKNALDWTSRPGAVEASPYAGKIALLLSTSPGGLGGLRALGHLRDILTNLGVLIHSRSHAVPQAHEVFKGEGQALDANTQGALEGLVREYLELVARLRGAEQERLTAA